jgi:hypothetical protein
MSFASVDKLQNILASKIFHYTKDAKKAAGRALGTFVELITYYVIKNWDLETFTFIERRLPEFANNEITHNVEFTLHGSRLIATSELKKYERALNYKDIVKKHFNNNDNINSKAKWIIDKDNVIKNASVLSENEESIVNVYVNSCNNSYKICELKKEPFAMFECKRVGVEEGMRKGPQTIEKAKQGSYVARTISSLQRIRLSDGTLGGI